MRKQALIVLMMILSLSSFAQVERVKAPVSQDEFESMLEKIQMVKSPAAKVEMAMVVAEKTHLTCRQIQEVAFILPDDKVRLQFALKAFERAVNPGEYYPIMDAFKLRSTAFRFYDAKEHKYKPEPQMEQVQIELNKEPVNVKPVIKYPDASNYTGKTNSNCKSPVSESQFKILAAQVKDVKSPQGQLSNALLLAEEYCLSVSQMMRLSLMMEDESIRYKFFSGAYEYVFDAGNFLAVRQMLETDYYKNKILVMHEPLLNEKPRPEVQGIAIEENNIEKENPEISDKPNGGCHVGERELNEMISYLKEQDFESDKIREAQMMIKRKRCFRTEQISQILGVFDYESTKLDMAKFAFPYVTDKANYYNIGRIFEFSSNKEELQEFIEMQ